MRLVPWSKPFQQSMSLPGDKSITHRAILFSALTHGVNELEGWLVAQDTEASLRLAQAWGVSVLERTPSRLVLQGPGGPQEWTEPMMPVDCANSGTTTRLGIGMATATPHMTVLYGDASLSRRPMARVTGPLKQLGADIWSRDGGLLPVVVRGGGVGGGTIRLQVASAQVKSGILLAGLSARDPVTVVEPIATRDHTERMLTAMGAEIRVKSEEERSAISIAPHPEGFEGSRVRVPGDPSSGAFWATLAALLPGSRLTLESVSLNPGRVGFYRLLANMGALVEFRERGRDPEPWGDIEISHRPLKAVNVAAAEVPAMIDELPLVALLATQATGLSEIRGAEELRVKESDRIQTTVEGLSRMGAQIEALADGFKITGATPIRGATVAAHDDHRIAMMLAVAAAVAQGPTDLEGAEAVAISYPAFFNTYGEFAR